MKCNNLGQKFVLLMAIYNLNALLSSCLIICLRVFLKRTVVGERAYK